MGTPWGFARKDHRRDVERLASDAGLADARTVALDRPRHGDILMRTAAILSLLGLLLGSPAAAQLSPAPAAQGQVIVLGAKLIAAGKTIDHVMRELNTWKKRIWHDWYCQYADGVIVHNDFRWYRTSDDVWNYFVGYPNKHDCDATITDSRGRRIGKFCTRDAEAFARAHGGIVYVGRE